MREYRKDWGGGLRVVGPAFACSSPQFEEVAQAYRAQKSQPSGPVIGGTDGEENARQRSQDGQGFVDCRPDEGQHSDQEYGEDNPIQHDPQPSQVFGERDTQETDYPVNRQIGNGPRGDDPQWGAFIRIISP